MLKLQLTRPLCAFDIESTSAKPLTAKIIELAIIKIMPDGSQNQLILLFNPGEPIPAEASAIHGFTDDQVKDKPLFKQLATTVSEFITDCDFLTFNGNSFDIPLLNEEFGRAGIQFDFSGAHFVDAGNLFKIFAPRTLSAAHKTYVGFDIEGAHGAEADTQATIRVLGSMLTTHSDDMPLTVPELALKSNFDRKRLDLAGKFKYNDLGVAVFAFGKWKDEPTFKSPDYLKWMIEAKDKDNKYLFSEDTRNVALKLQKGEHVDLSGTPAKLPTFSQFPKHAPDSTRPQGNKY